MKTYIEYRKLKRNGKCAVCYCDIEKDKDKVRVIQPYVSKTYQISICDDCAYKIFYAPILTNIEGKD